VGDLIFVGSCNGVFRALDRKTGEVRWATHVAPDSNKYFFHGDPFITPDLIVIGADPGTGGVHAFDRSTGRQRWKYSVGQGVSGAIVGLGRLAYAIRNDDQLLALDIESGAVKWSFPIDVWGWLRPATAADRVFAGARDGSVYALNAETGHVEWQTNVGAGVSTSVTATPNGLYVGTGDGAIVRLDARHGDVLLSRKIDDKLKPRDAPVLAGDSLLLLMADEGESYRPWFLWTRTSRVFAGGKLLAGRGVRRASSSGANRRSSEKRRAKLLPTALLTARPRGRAASAATCEQSAVQKTCCM